MDFNFLHAWNVSPAEAIQIQKSLKERVQIQPLKKSVQLIAGADISFNRFSSTAFAVFVVIHSHTFQIVEKCFAVSEMSFPYIPGLLSFREIPALIEAWKKLQTNPDVVVVDGQGIAHPRRLGIASHLGLLLNRPTIGCAKTRLTGKYVEPPPEAGTYTPLKDHNQIIGAALRTKTKTQPIYVSPGHLIDLNRSIQILLSMVTRYRIPEPTRQAHLYANRVRIDQNLGQAA